MDLLPLPSKKSVGQRGELAAARHMRRRGFRVRMINAHTPIGEIDIICESRDRTQIVFVEVKSRMRAAGAPSTSNSVAPEANITSHKRHKLVSVAEYLVKANDWAGKSIRIDVVAVEFERGKRRPVEIRHHENAVRG